VTRFCEHGIESLDYIKFGRSAGKFVSFSRKNCTTQFAS